MMAEIRDEVKPISGEKYELIKWTTHEKLFRNKESVRNQILSTVAVPLSVALFVKFKRSLFGTYLKYFNGKEAQNEFLNFNKLSITEDILANFRPQKIESFDVNNNLLDDLLMYLQKTITETPELDLNYLYKDVIQLRLDNFHINLVDDAMKYFQNLHTLVLCGNWITDIEGSYLPRSLKFLELYCNEIRSVTNLVHNIPKDLEHLGLGRNKLTNESSLHLLAQSRRLHSLTNLDISECDIYSLVDVLNELQEFRNIDGLNLQGNPCSVVESYKDAVLFYLPNLVILDGTVISKEDRKINDECLTLTNSALLYLNSLKVTNLQKTPKNEKKTVQTIHIEFLMPLFQENLKTTQETAASENLESPKRKPKKERLKKKKTKKSKKESLYDKANEYNPNVINNSFSTERKKWTKVLNYPTVALKSPENNFEAFRDTFRSNIPVRLVYVKKQLPEKKKKKGKKQKGKSKKDKKSKKHSKSTKKTVDKSLKLKNKKPKEKILKEITLAEFSCDLYTPNWSDHGVSFIWKDNSSFGKSAIEKQTYLDNLRKIEEEKRRIKETLKEVKKKKSERSDKKSKKSGKSLKGSKSRKSKKSRKSNKSKKSKSSKKSKKSLKEEKALTCEVTFSLSRLGQVLKTHELKGKKKSRKSKGKKSKVKV